MIEDEICACQCWVLDFELQITLTDKGLGYGECICSGVIASDIIETSISICVIDDLELETFEISSGTEGSEIYGCAMEGSEWCPERDNLSIRTRRTSDWQTKEWINELESRTRLIYEWSKKSTVIGGNLENSISDSSNRECPYIGLIIAIDYDEVLTDIGIIELTDGDRTEIGIPRCRSI